MISGRILPFRSFKSTLRAHCRLPRRDAVALEIIGELGDGDILLGIGRDFADDDRAFHGLLMTHNEDIRCGEVTRCHHLIADAFVPEALVDGDRGTAQHFEDAKRSAPCFHAEVGEVHEGRCDDRALVETRLAARFH